MQNISTGEDHRVGEIVILFAVYHGPAHMDSLTPQLGRRELASLALVSRKTYPLTNPLLYKSLEISFCKCSDQYLNALANTMSTCRPLAAMVDTLFVDMLMTCRVKAASSSLEDLRSAKWHDKFKWKLPTIGNNPGPSESREVAHGVKHDVDWHRDSMEALQLDSVKTILTSLWNLNNITVRGQLINHESN